VHFQEQAMTITIKPVTIRGLDITHSVGKDGFNDPDDIFTVKTLLNGIGSDAGGTDGTLDASDTSKTGPDFDRLVEAITIFQKLNFTGVFPPDGLVEPGKKTIRRLQRFFALRHGGDVPVLSTVLPSGPLFGDANATGFSAARLSRSGPGVDWSSRNPFLPVTQMVPVGSTRKLVVTNTGSVAASFQVSPETIATIDASDNTSVTVRGNSFGKADLTVSLEGQSPVKVKLVVRRVVSMPVNCIHLGPPPVPGDERIFLKNTLPGIKRIYEGQTNITFTEGNATIALEVTINGVRTPVDPSRPFVFEELVGPPDPNKQGCRLFELRGMVPDKSAMTIFLGPNLVDDRSPNIVGASLRGEKIAWFNTKPLRNLSNRLTVPAHEMGHSLGLPHITAPANFAYLMNPVVQINNIIIPSDTLEDLIVN
jgi:hypothetical protein